MRTSAGHMSGEWHTGDPMSVLSADVETLFDTLTRCVTVDTHELGNLANRIVATTMDGVGYIVKSI